MVRLIKKAKNDLSAPWRTALLATYVSTFLLAAHIDVASAQTNQPPFSTVTLRAGPTFNVKNEKLDPLWQPDLGGMGTLEIPFYWGRVEAGLAGRTRKARTQSVPSFNSLFIFLGWRGRWSPIPRLQLSAGPRLGNYVMFFGESERLSGLERESEVMVALSGRLAVDLSRNWGVFISGSYQKLFTAHRIHLAYVGVGVSRTLKMPSWLQDFLQ